MTLEQTLSQLREKVSKMIPVEAAAEVRALNDLYDQYQQAGVELVVVSPQSAGRAKSRPRTAI